MLIEHCKTCFEVLSDETRLKVFELIKANKGMCVGEIVEKFNLRQPTISYHLDVLKKADLLTSERESQKMHYSLEEKPGKSHVCLTCPVTK
ncbi:MAG TPA: metalloregulator ArsR/SmtB family transcription factor [Patescibacteria group bacterium]|nr:metalloregulator ArsR/SmtB family transcription factor [Patescibacteria group bacterium]